jgi:hypothetical protein
MEEGSLLQEALNRENELENSLIVDVFCLAKINQQPPTESSSIATLLTLAETAVALNEFLQAKNYPWLSGGDGPVFGATIADGIPCVRAVCRYGVSVADEWTLIRYMLQFTAGRSDLAVECWDIDDGHVLLIQAAEVLPLWVDQIGPEQCRRRCWIRNGKVHVIAPVSAAPASSEDSLSLKYALILLHEESSLITQSDLINQVIQETCRRIETAGQWHQTALAVPRSVAWLVQRRPDLVAAACHAFLQNASKKSLPKQHESLLAGTCEDWVWTIATMGRTHYSILRTMVAPPVWITDDAIPTVYQSIEVRRLKRVSAAQVTPHLRYGLQVGVRLVAGLDYLLQQQASKVPTTIPAALSLAERRILYWSRMDTECRPLESGSGGGGNWLREAWEAGPNQSRYNIDSILNCPVFDEEVNECATPISRPQESVSVYLRKELVKMNHPERDFFMPRIEEVDSEDWMTMPSEEEMAKAAAPVPFQSRSEAAKPAVPKDDKALDEVLESFQSFMTSKSGVEGISSRVDDEPERRPIQINPTVFLNMMHTVLQAKSADEIDFVPASEQQDPFFSQEDYEMMEPEDDGETDGALMNLMKAMDQELQQSTATSRVADRDNLPDGVNDETVVEDAHVLSNLLQSLDAGGGGPGPVQNIMKEMGLAPPDFPSEEPE